jgi:hypothetical protein
MSVANDGADVVAKNPHIAGGEAFYYADSNNPNVRLSDRSINDPKSAIGATVSQAIDKFFKKATDSFYMFYNDQPPKAEGGDEKELSHRAHAKGVMAFDKKQGFWLIHSAVRRVCIRPRELGHRLIRHGGFFSVTSVGHSPTN